MITLPVSVHVSDVALGCGACLATMTVPQALVEWWVGSHRHPRILGVQVSIDGGEPEWWRRR